MPPLVAGIASGALLLGAAYVMDGSRQHADETRQQAFEAAQSQRNREYTLSLTVGASRDLTGVDLSGKDLRGQSLGGKVLVDARLVNANLSNAYLFGVDARFIRAHNVRLTGATLDCARLDSGHLDHAFLEKTKLFGVDAAAVDLSHATLVGANTEIQGPIDFSDCPQAQAISDKIIATHRIRLYGPVGDQLSLIARTPALRTALLEEQRHRYADFSSASFDGANLHGADLEMANFAGASFDAADLTGAVLSGSNLSGARFNDRTRLSALDLDQVDLTNADLAGADLHRSRFREIDDSCAPASEACLTSTTSSPSVTASPIPQVRSVHPEARRESLCATASKAGGATIDGTLGIESMPFYIGDLLPQYGDFAGDLDLSRFRSIGVVTNGFPFRNLTATVGSSRIAFLHGANLAGANMSGLDLSTQNDTFDARLYNRSTCPNFFESFRPVAPGRWRDDEFKRAWLHLVNHLGADLVDADMRGANLAGTNLSGADLRGADLRGAKLAGTRLRTRGRSVCFDATTRWPKGFSPPRPSC